MLKLPKGLKKKKKGKKSKKDQELFTEEELAQYKREHRDHSAAHSAATSDTEESTAASTAEKPDNDEEWSKFAVLTSGIDSILKKTQGDLDRIKSTSFFQKVPTQVEQTKAKKEHERLEKEKAEEEAKVEEAKAAEKEPGQELIDAVVELSASESSEDEPDDIFDTTYIDQIAPVLAYIPDSPTLEELGGPDPFDTSYADKVIKGPEVSKKGKKIVSIGSAVEVLTGRVDKVTPAATAKRPRRGPKNLLLDEGEEDLEEDIGATGTSLDSQPILTLLDDPAELQSDEPIDLSVSLHLVLQKEQEKAKEQELDLSEFEDLKKSEEDDEFAVLASESLHTLDSSIKVVTSTDLAAELDTDWAEFKGE
jgi:hypothetical protein